MWRRWESNPPQSACKADSPTLGTCAPTSSVLPAGVEPASSSLKERGLSRSGHGSVGQSGRQESNLRRPPYQGGASPLGHGPISSAPCGTRTRPTCSTDKPPHPLRHRAEKSARRESHPPRPPWHGGASAARPRTRHQSAEGTGVEPARAFASPGFQPGAVACRLALPFPSCPGRTRTCTRLGNGQPHHRCATGQ